MLLPGQTLATKTALLPTPRLAATAVRARLQVTMATARAHWLSRQGLGAPVGGSIDEVVERTGWVRTLGGADVYLAVRARVPGMRRADLERAVDASKVQVVPAARGCIYLVPRTHVALALKIGEESWRPRAEREHAQAGIDPKELAELGRAIVETLRGRALGTDAIKKALPETAVRSLGEKGKKLGLSTTLPPALRQLEFEGRIERTLEGGRLDSERYLWRLPARDVFLGAKIGGTAQEREVTLARVFFGQSGPSTAKDFAAWSGLGLREAQLAMTKAGLASIDVEGKEAFILEEHRNALTKAVVGEHPPRFLPFDDNYITAHGGPKLLLPKQHHRITVPAWGRNKKTTLGTAAHIFMRTIVEGSEVAGFWEWDGNGIVFGALDKKMPAARKQAWASEAESIAALLRELGHARSVTLDNDESIAARAKIVRSFAR